MPATLIDPSKQQPQPQPAAPAASPGGATVIDPSKPAPMPTPGVTSGQPGSATTIDPNRGSVAGTGTWGDFGTVAGNESLMYGLPGLRAQAEAARQRLGPNWSAAADIAGSIGSPTSLLNMVPYVGPELAGGAHEGIKSAMTNWDDPSWTDYLAKVGKDTAGGVATAGLGHGAAELAPKLLPELAKWGVMQGIPAGYVASAIHGATGNVGLDVAGAAGVFGLLNKPGNWAKAAAEKIADQPATQNIIKLLAQGAGSAYRNASPGPLWDRWVPWQ